MSDYEQVAASSRGRDGAVYFERERGVAELQVRRGVAHVALHLPADCVAARRLELLHLLADAQVSLLLIKLLPDGISFAVRGDVLPRCEMLLQKFQADFTLERHLALVTLVAGAMRDLSGVLCRIYDAMVRADVRVLQTGDAYNAVHCLVAEADIMAAAGALQQAFCLGEANAS